MTHMLSRGSAVYFIQISFLSRMFFMVHATETEVNGVVWYTIVLTRTRGSGTCTTAAVLQTCSVEGCTESSLAYKYYCCCRRTTACDDRRSYFHQALNWTYSLRIWRRWRRSNWSRRLIQASAKPSGIRSPRHQNELCLCACQLGNGAAQEIKPSSCCACGQVTSPLTDRS